MATRNINDAHEILQEAWSYARKIFNEKHVGEYAVKCACVYDVDKEKHNKKPSHAIDIFFLDLKTREACWKKELFFEFRVYMKEQNPTLVIGSDYKTLSDMSHFEI